MTCRHITEKEGDNNTKIQIQTHRYREQADGCQRGWGGGLGSKGEGDSKVQTSSYTISHGDENNIRV